MRILWKNALLDSGIVFASGAILGNLLYMNPVVAGIYSRMAGHPAIKSWKEFGSIGNFVALNMAMGILLSAVYLGLFSLMRGRLPAHWLPAGLLFAAAVILVKAAPEAFNQFMNIRYPTGLVLTQLANSCLGIIGMGLVLSACWDRWPAVG